MWHELRRRRWRHVATHRYRYRSAWDARRRTDTWWRTSIPEDSGTACCPSSSSHDIPTCSPLSAADTLQSPTDNAILGSRLRPRSSANDFYSLLFIVKQNSVGIDAVPGTLQFRLIRSRRLGIHVTHHWTHFMKAWRHPQNRKYTTYCNIVIAGARTEPPRPQAICRINLLKFGRVVSK